MNNITILLLGFIIMVYAIYIFDRLAEKRKKNTFFLYTIGVLPFPIAIGDFFYNTTFQNIPIKYGNISLILFAMTISLISALFAHYEYINRKN